MSMDSSASLDALCDQLARATSARKVLVCGEDGTILAHAGERGVFTNQVAADLANLVAQVLVETQQLEPEVNIPVEDRYTQVGRLHVCAAPLADRALLLVLFDDSTEIGQVRVRVRRARPLMLRILSGNNQAPAAS
jgi:predicted regulator of Ras-like GTPase activity (Roadblock/LC7/MglB family)